MKEKTPQQKYYEANKEKISAQRKARYEANKELFKERSEKNKEKQKEYYETNKEKISEQQKKYYEENKQTFLQNRKKYREENKNIITTYKTKYHKNKLNTNPIYKLKHNIRSLIRESIKKRGHKKLSKTEIILGCTFEEFKNYIESKWESWMTWDNYGNPKDGVFEPNKTWDYDHIIPMKEGLTEIEVIKLNHHTNIQPMCSYHNRFVKR
jgi:hypothetical protein